MKNLKKQITLFLTLIVFISSFVFSFSLDKIYASGYNTVNEFQVSAVKSSTSKPKSSSYKKSKTTLNNKTSLKVNSGSFSTNSSSSYKSSASSSSSTNKSSSTKKNNTSTNKTTIKPDSGSFTTKPNTNSSTNSGSSYSNSSSSGSSSSVKPDSGSFSTKPKTDKKKEDNTNSDYDSGKTYRPYGSWGRRTYIPMYGRGLFGYNPFRGFGYRMGISSMIMDIVMVITILIVAYIIFDMIRSRRNRK